MVREATGFDDEIPVSREAYAAWIIEDVLPAGSPDLAAVGAVMAADVERLGEGQAADPQRRPLDPGLSRPAASGTKSVAEAMGDPLSRASSSG